VARDGEAVRRDPFRLVGDVRGPAPQEERLVRLSREVRERQRGAAGDGASTDLPDRAERVPAEVRDAGHRNRARRASDSVELVPPGAFDREHAGADELGPEVVVDGLLTDEHVDVAVDDRANQRPSGRPFVIADGRQTVGVANRHRSGGAVHRERHFAVDESDGRLDERAAAVSPDVLDARR